MIKWSNGFYTTVTIAIGFFVLNYDGFAAVGHKTAFVSSKGTQNDTSQIELKNQTQTAYPMVDTISFTGNHKVNSARLLKFIPLKKNQEADEIKITQSMIAIADLYKKNHMKVTITPVIGKISNNHTKIQFNIHEP